MALLVHLAAEKEIESIRRAGIKPRRLKQPLNEGYDRIVFAMPVTDNFHVSHQWLRELKRGGQRTIVGVYFRIPDDQIVMVGHYNQNHQLLTAVEAIGVIFNAEQPEGFEIIVPRKIQPSEIHKIISLPQVIGWRYYPDAKGNKPCGCPFCTKGDINSKRIRVAYEKSFDD
ncbi:MAG: hypothetical protein KDA78_03270 [Planctomycetaceae bacterium]|nr:hypothetical protein [Planctomycetaceae bacterium]